MATGGYSSTRGKRGEDTCGVSGSSDVPRKILIAVDASEHSLEAVRYVGRILPVEGTGITLFHVLDSVPECFWDLDLAPSSEQCRRRHPWQARQREIIHDFMNRAESILVDLGYPKRAVSVLIEEREIGIARDIARRAREGFDALVLGRTGMSPVRDLIFGSIAHKLLTHLIQTTVWAIGGRPETSRILIAMDSSEGALRALDYVGEIFGRAHPELLLLHVTRWLDFLPPDGEGTESNADWLKQAREELAKAGTAMANIFEGCIGRLESKGADAGRIRTKIVPGVYSRAAAIYGEALDEGCGTIVVGRRGLSQVEEFLMGRVSNKVLQLAREMAVWLVH